MRRQVTITEVMQDALDSLQGELYVSMPGTVLAYNAAKQTATIQPTLADVRYDVDTQQPYYEPWPVLQNIRVMWPQFGGATIAGNLNVNDTVTLCAWDFDPSGITQPGSKVINPADVRKLSGNYWRAYAEALIAPLPTPEANAAASGLLMGIIGGSQWQITTGGIVSLVGAKQITLGDAATTSVTLGGSSTKTVTIGSAATTTATLGGSGTTAVNLGPATEPLALAPPIVTAWQALAIWAQGITAAAAAGAAAPDPTGVAFQTFAAAVQVSGAAVATALATAETATPAQVVKGA